MTTAYSGYGILTPDSTDLNRTAHRIRYKHNINNNNNNKPFLLISNAHITQEWQLIVNTAMTEN
jgi:hypothetical protein